MEAFRSFIDPLGDSDGASAERSAYVKARFRAYLDAELHLNSAGFNLDSLGLSIVWDDWPGTEIAQAGRRADGSYVIRLSYFLTEVLLWMSCNQDAQTYKAQLQRILEHEMAHVWCLANNSDDGHGPHFMAIMAKLGLPQSQFVKL